MPDTPKTPCPFCGHEATREDLTIEINQDEQIRLELNLFDVFAHIKKLEDEIKDLIEVIKEHLFKTPKDK